MKNFSIPAGWLAGALFAAVAAASPAQAASCEFKPNAPDQHKVVRGDTLWDISGTFLEHPWCWPTVWGMNKDEIRNPHWIYPGQIIYFDRANKRLSLTPPGSGGAGAGGRAGDPPVVRLAPQIRTEGLGRDAIPSIRADVIEPFLAQHLVVGENEMNSAPRVVAMPDNRYFVGSGDKLYVRGDLKGGTTFQVFRQKEPVIDPVAKKLVAYEAYYLGTVTLSTPGKNASEASIFTVSNAKEEIGVGDLLLPAPPSPIINYVPHPAELRGEARVVQIHGGINYASQNQIVLVNRGTIDGLDIGSVLNLYHAAKTMTDPTRKGLLGFGGEKMTLPEERYGTLFIFRVFKNVSYGLIMEVNQPVEIGDMAKSPE